jgi:hypothetical protein
VVFVLRDISMFIGKILLATETFTERETMTIQLKDAQPGDVVMSQVPDSTQWLVEVIGPHANGRGITAMIRHPSRGLRPLYLPFRSSRWCEFNPGVGDDGRPYCSEFDGELEYGGKMPA